MAERYPMGLQLRGGFMTEPVTPGLSQEIEQALSKSVRGEVRFDRFTRLLYATDASMYQIEPIGVVIPRDKDDVIAAVQVANQFAVPVLPRGGGTSLAGQTVGHAVVIDCSRYMNRLNELNQEEGWAWVGPGLVQDELNALLRPKGLLFGPDTATSNRATIGGMVGNNSAGSHSIAYGKTVDHVLELRCVLADGSEALFGPVGSEAISARQRGNGLGAKIYQVIPQIVAAHRDEILRRYPAIMRRVSGYNLDEFVRDKPFNLAKLIVGSEGTLASVVEAKVRVLPHPKRTALVVLHFKELSEALSASPEILETSPYALELVDKMILDLAKGSIEYARRTAQFLRGDPDAILLVEYSGEDEGEVRGKAEGLVARIQSKGIGYATVTAFEPDAQQNIWKVRKAGLGLLLGTKGEKKPIAFVEDTAVAPERLPEFLRRFRQILAKHDVRAGYYGHCSVGCLHIRPLINLKRTDELAKVRAIATEITELVLEFGGALSGEHGDGLARSMWNEKLFGREIYQAFRQVKGAFDPKGLMNPGKIVDAPDMLENLRYGDSYQTWEPETVLDFSSQGGFAAAVEMCNGVGVCRKKLEGTMCPSYMATMDEEHTTRGRANALRAVLSGKAPREEFTGRRLFEVLDLCLECKGCKAECPSNVDMAKLKYEFLHHYYEANGLPLRNRLFGKIERLNRVGCMLAPVSNWIAALPMTRWLNERLFGIDHRRPLPPFASPTFLDWFRAHRPGGTGERGEVLLFHDTFNTYNTPGVAIAAAKLLERAGYRLLVVEKRCCGRPMISKGMLREARELTAWNIERLAPFAERGVPIVGLEPSCVLTLRDEYPELLKDPRAKLVAEQSYLLEEFLERERARGLALPFAAGDRRALFHGHCHQKALVGTGPTVALLEWAGYQVEEVDSGCCGMAGSFGFEKEHYDLSVAIGQRRLIPAVKAAAFDTVVVTPGISCRQQIRHLAGRTALHPAEAVWQALQG